LLIAVPNPAPAKITPRSRAPAAIRHLTHAENASAISDKTVIHTSKPMKIDHANQAFAPTQAQPAMLD
jgi:hypothetical protein